MTTEKLCFACGAPTYVPTWDLCGQNVCLNDIPSWLNDNEFDDYEEGEEDEFEPA